MPSALAVSVFLLVSRIVTPCAAIGFDLSLRSLQSYMRAVQPAVLEDFQVYPPVLTVTPAGVLEITDGSSNASVQVVPSTHPPCQQTLVVHSFAFSYGQPFVGPYTPPPCAFNRVTWNLTVLSAGRQYDRLGTVSFGDIELFRTSTAEPTANGIEWTYLKDMTNFLPLFKQDNTIIFDLGNLINNVYTGPYNVTLSASYFTADDSITPADLILPVSTEQGSAGQPSYFTVPPDTASSNLTFPRNVKKAVFTIAATGQNEEEFWWSNVLQSEIDTFPAFGLEYGYSPFREVQLFIDNMLAGVAWPFPVIFTGGVVPGLWRPIVGIDAFDLKEDEIDVTPWLPLLCDGNPHNFTIRVSGLNDDGNGTATLSETTLPYWYVVGKVFLWLDHPGHITTGDGPSANSPAPDFQVSSNVYQAANGSNVTLTYQVNARRSLSFHSTLHLSTGSEPAFWSQDLTFVGAGNYTESGYITTNTLQTSGYAVSSSGYARKFTYPLYAYLTEALAGDNLTLFADVHRGKTVQTLGQPVFPTGLEAYSAAAAVRAQWPSFEGAALSTAQSGSATFTENGDTLAAEGFGSTTQDMTFAGIRTAGGSTNPAQWQGGFPPTTGGTELFQRHVAAANTTILYDRETLVTRPIGHFHGAPLPDSGSPPGAGPLLSGVPGRGGRFRRGGAVNARRAV